MDVTSSSSGPRALPGAGAPAPGTERKNLGKDQFLTLLTTQMQAQDPLNPMDNTEFVAQLSQFTSLERLETMSGAIDSMAMSMASNTSAQMVSFIGKQVVASSNTLSLEPGGGQVGEFGFELGGQAAAVRATIKDDQGRVVRTLELGGLAGGKHALGWDGLKDDGGTLAAGTYTVEFKATDDQDAALGVEAFSTRKVTGVRYAHGVPRLELEGELSIGLGEIRQVNQ